MTVCEDTDHKAVLKAARLVESTQYKLDQEDPTVYSDGEGDHARHLRQEWPNRPKTQRREPTATVSRVESAAQPNLDPAIQKLIPFIREGASLLKEHGISVKQPQKGHREGIPQKDKKSSVSVICGKSFITAYKCGLHYKSKHLYESQWTCSKCGKLLTSQSNLDAHMQSYSKFKCFYCNKMRSGQKCSQV